MSRDDYPHDGPLASRRVKRTLTEPEDLREGDPSDSQSSEPLPSGSVSVPNRHLFLANGDPPITPAQRQLLRKTQKHLHTINIAHSMLVDAIRDDNPKDCATAIRSLTANAVYLTGYVNDAENDAA